MGIQDTLAYYSMHREPLKIIVAALQLPANFENRIVSLVPISPVHVYVSTVHVCCSCSHLLETGQSNAVACWFLVWSLHHKL